MELSSLPAWLPQAHLHPPYSAGSISRKDWTTQLPRRITSSQVSETPHEAPYNHTAVGRWSLRGHSEVEAAWRTLLS